MDVFDALLRQAVSGLLAGNLTLTEEAAGKASQDASVQLLRKICALALDPSIEDAQALENVRALCTQAQTSSANRACRQGQSEYFFRPTRFRRTFSFPHAILSVQLIQCERTSYPGRHAPSIPQPCPRLVGGFFIRSKGSQKFLKFA